MPDTAISVGQIYLACPVSDGSRRIRIESYAPGDARAEVVDADSGKRPRQILVTQLHSSPLTEYGRPRRNGYAIDTGPTTWRIKRSFSRAFPWEWACTATVTTGPQTRQCSANGLGRTPQDVRHGAEQHTRATHPELVKDGADQ
ncbi:hypothetical protein [Streptomyces luteireticuli]|uniref:hypothetical protein n=1 Tax=Streptomyces luteireticuli TaxID=173858 RepID=UPI0035577E25